ncbi:hypothetical protein J437_LFUL013285 [Ladona fulva]|uniref:Uncharacterized protein n=1 Tax=Ladona fulva TaxID=123851 RepID=A0A8K0KD95_LADFU|nr:hypothetical protein J437_LFUL013285 [Ladona fulva]
MCNNCCCSFHLFTSLTGVGLGVTAFFVFFHLNNIDAGSWALVSAVFAGVVFHLHYIKYCRNLDSYHDVNTLKGIQFLGLMVTTIGVTGTVWYIFNAVYYSIPMLPVNRSAYIAAVWTFMTAKWGLMLLIFGKIYANVIRRENPPLLAVSRMWFFPVGCGSFPSWLRSVFVTSEMDSKGLRSDLIVDSRCR